jgi:hypothetical protein
VDFPDVAFIGAHMASFPLLSDPTVFRPSFLRFAQAALFLARPRQGRARAPARRARFCASSRDPPVLRRIRAARRALRRPPTLFGFAFGPWLVSFSAR